MLPHDVAWDALQKEEQDEEEEDFQLYDDDGNLHPEYVSCPTCHGQGYRDEGSGDPYHGGETCLHCWGHGVVHRTEEENRPIDDLMSDFAANPTPETMQSVNQYFAEEPEMVFPEKFSNLMTGEPMDLTWRLLKSGLSFPTDDDDEDDDNDNGFEPFAGKTEAEREEFMASLRREWAKPEDEQYTSHVLDAGPHWTLDDRQKKVVEAALNVPDTHPNHNWGTSHYMREESHDMFGHFSHLFDHNSYQVPDHEYDRAVAVINNYAKEIDAHMSNPNADMSEEFMDDITNPEHPWTKAVEGYDGPLSVEADDWQTKNTGEPMDLAWRLLKYDEEENLYYNDDGTPRDPRVNPAFDENITDDSYGLQLDDEIDEIRDTPGFHDGVETEFTPEEIEEKERRKKVKESVAGFLQSQKLASEPMSLAWRLLKETVDDSKRFAAPNFKGSFYFDRETQTYRPLKDKPAE